MNDNQLNELFRKLIEEIQELKSQLLLHHNPITPDWLPREIVMKYMGYADTQMSSMERRENLIVSKIGKRKFYRKDSNIEPLPGYRRRGFSMQL
jgi:hypothetical protein